MPGTVPRWSWPKLGAVTNRIINVYCRKDVPSRSPRYVDMPPLQKAALPETTICSRYVWLSNTTGNLGPANSHEKRSHGIVAGWFAKEMRTIKFVFPAASDFCFSALLAMLASYPLVVARPHAELVSSAWKQLPPHQSARPVQEAKMHVVRVAHCKLDIMMIIKHVSIVQFRSLCSSYRPRPLPREFPHANLPLI